VFLADPAVLVLDEPTAHLDVETAGALLDDLWQVAAGGRCCWSPTAAPGGSSGAGGWRSSGRDRPQDDFIPSG
jgi:hypothetical protein